MGTARPDFDQSAALESAAAGDDIVAVEPELIHHALTATLGTSADYARRLSRRHRRLLESPGDDGRIGSGHRRGHCDVRRHQPPHLGLQAARADSCPYDRSVCASYRAGHRFRPAPSRLRRPPDHRTILRRRPGPQDGPATARIASAPEIFARKVLNDQGRGTDSGILAGINWAVANNCAIVSMSLGADARTVSQAYEHTRRRALDRGTLIIAAAGNTAARPGDPGFVGVPANSPSVMAVAAVDSRMAVAQFSAASNPVDGGQIDIAAPGVSVFSSWPSPMGHPPSTGREWPPRTCRGAPRCGSRPPGTVDATRGLC